MIRFPFASHECRVVGMRHRYSTLRTDEFAARSRWQYGFSSAPLAAGPIPTTSAAPTARRKSRLTCTSMTVVPPQGAGRMVEGRRGRRPSLER